MAFACHRRFQASRIGVAKGLRVGMRLACMAVVRGVWGFGYRGGVGSVLLVGGLAPGGVGAEIRRQKNVQVPSWTSGPARCRCSKPGLKVCFNAYL